jgi:hypothetical protein
LLQVPQFHVIAIIQAEPDVQHAQSRVLAFETWVRLGSTRIAGAFSMVPNGSQSGISEHNRPEYRS